MGEVCPNPLICLPEEIPPGYCALVPVGVHLSLAAVIGICALLVCADDCPIFSASGSQPISAGNAERKASSSCGSGWARG